MTEPLNSVAPLVNAVLKRSRFSTVLKMVTIGFLTLLLLIPISMVESVLRERLDRRNEAVKEVTGTWGGEQVVMGPILVVPYKYTQTTWKDQVINGRSERLEVTESLAGRAFFLPHSFKVEAKLDPDRLHRGIYEAVVYRATLRLSGDFAKPVIEDSTESAQQMRWDEAEIALAISDLRGAKQALVLKIGESSLTLEPGSRLEDSTARWRMADVVQR